MLDKLKHFNSLNPATDTNYILEIARDTTYLGFTTGKGR